MQCWISYLLLALFVYNIEHKYVHYITPQNNLEVYNMPKSVLICAHLNVSTNQKISVNYFDISSNLI